MHDMKKPRPSWYSDGATEESFTAYSHSVPAVHPWIVTSPARMFKVYEQWPHGQKVALRVTPGALLTIDLDQVRTERPDLNIFVQSTCPVTARRWQAAITYGTFRALHGLVIA